MRTKTRNPGLGRALALALTLVACLPAQAAPKYKILHAFGKGNDGAGLWSSLTFDDKSNLYGATSGGGEFGYGIVFKLTPQPRGAWSESILHSFKDNYDPGGSEPNGGLVQDAHANWYGTTTDGNIYDAGVVFELADRPQGWAEETLYSFGQQNNDGGNPTAGLVIDDAGDLYGTAPYGGPLLRGAVFELAPGAGGWKETIIDGFGQKNDGAAPFAGLIRDANRNLYGTTRGGGAYGVGTVFELSPGAGGEWKETLLHSFDDNGKDGVDPGWGALFMDGLGSLYGTTAGGGTYFCGGDDTPAGGIGNCGTIFKLTKNANGHWREAVIYNFAADATGFGPNSGVVMDRAGSLYGVTMYSGSGCGCGVVYKLAPTPKGKWKYTVLHTFIGYDGAQPDANLILDGKGNLYGTTATGGAYGGGVVFELTP